MEANGEEEKDPRLRLRAYPLTRSFLLPSSPYFSPEGRFNYNNHNVTVPGILPGARSDLCPTEERLIVSLNRGQCVSHSAPVLFLWSYRVWVIFFLFFFFILLPVKNTEYRLARVCSQSDSDLVCDSTCPAFLVPISYEISVHSNSYRSTIQSHFHMYFSFNIRFVFFFKYVSIYQRDVAKYIFSIYFNVNCT